MHQPGLLLLLSLPIPLVVFAAEIGVVRPHQARSGRGLASIFKDGTALPLAENASLIRETFYWDIVEGFSCKDKPYGYYADIPNQCQIFHVCLPRSKSVSRWSFICPSETVFNQATFVCTRIENSIPCQESEKFYKLNEAIGKECEEEEESDLAEGKKRKRKAGKQEG